MTDDIRIGHGYDVHRLVPDRKLILGGVEIPYEKGLLGHSDADVLLHAVMDALLGALAMGDIDATVLAQAPKLAPYIPQIRENLANICKIPPYRVSVKATTEEGLGFTGQGLGIAAHAVCLLIGSGPLMPL